MRQDRGTSSGLRLITAVICIILFILPGAVFAETLVNNTSSPLVTTSIPGVIIQTTTAVPTVPLTRGTTSSSSTVTTTVVTAVTSQQATPVPTARENTTAAVNPPPLLILGTPKIENLTVTMYGTVAPGSANVTMASTRWDWGDNQPLEYHGFPYSHGYSSPGTYTLTITAQQSDHQYVTKTTSIFAVQPVIPLTIPATMNTTVTGTPLLPVIANTPLLTLLEPVTDGMNVTVNGNLNPGSPGVTIDSVSAEWNDGTITKTTDLPVTHQYSEFGIYTISITGKQSDGLSTTKRITMDLKEEVPGFPGPVTPHAPPNETPVYLIIIATAIIVVAIVVVVQQISMRRRGRLHPPEIPKNFTPRAGPRPENLPSPEELAVICSGTDVTPEVLDPVIRVAVEIAREGREGQAIGTSFVVGDTDNVLTNSKQFVLNPFHGYHEAKRQITDAGVRGNIKEFAQLDGAFLVTGTGVVEAAGRCITVDLSKVNLPGGLGSRHSSVAGITQVTRSIGVVVSQSGGLISIFRDGKIVYTISP
ncbi:MAG: diadenylate cyclase [Methanomicrobiales archaeon]